MPASEYAHNSCSALDFYLRAIDLCIADVFDRVRRQLFQPDRRFEPRYVGGLAGVERHVAERVAPDEIAPSEDEEDARPAMSVHWSCLPGRMRVCKTRTWSFSNRTVWLPGAAVNASSESGHGQIFCAGPERSELNAQPPMSLLESVSQIGKAGRLGPGL